MDAKQFVDDLCSNRDFHTLEIAKYKNMPYRYTNEQFKKIESTYWTMCVPMIYAHWEAFVITTFKKICDFINRRNIDYGNIVAPLAILANRSLYSRLSGNQDYIKHLEFYKEYMEVLKNPVNLDRSLCVSANSNLNFKQLTKLARNFGIDLDKHFQRSRSGLEKLVKFRNIISHEVNGVVVNEKDVKFFSETIIELIDELIVSVEDYITNEKFIKTL